MSNPSAANLPRRTGFWLSVVLVVGMLVGALSQMPLAFVVNQFEHPALDQARFEGTVWQGRAYPPDINAPVEITFDWRSLLTAKPGFRLVFSTESTAINTRLRYAQSQWVLQDLAGTHQVAEALLPAALVGQNIGALLFSAEQIVLGESGQLVGLQLLVGGQRWSGMAEFDGLRYRAVIEPPAEDGLFGELIVEDQWPFHNLRVQWRSDA